MFGLRVVLAEDDPILSRHLKALLAKAGHAVIADAADGRTAARLIFDLVPDVAILEARLRGRSGLEVARVVREQTLVPVVLTSRDGYWEIIEEAKKAGVYACLVKPFTESALITAVELACANFQRLVALERENRRLKEDLETRKLVERAKELLVGRNKMSEGEAYQYLRKLSMDSSTSLKRVARQVIMQFASKLAE